MEIRLAVIGTGRIAKRAVNEINEVDGLVITTVVNPNAEHSIKFAVDNGIKDYSSDIGRIAGIADAAYIASPHGTHYEYARNLLEMGIHVICEKPAVLKSGQAAELISLAQNNGLVFMEAVKTAYCPGFRQIEEIVASGRIGDVVDVDAAFTKLTSMGGREFADLEYGGAFTELGSYSMLPILRFLGSSGFDCSFMHRDVGAVDGYTKVLFDYGDRFACAKTGLSVKSEGQLIVSGTKGYILVPSPWWLTKYFEVRYEDPLKIEKYECEFKGDGLRYEFAEFIKRINDGQPMPADEISEMRVRAGIYEDFLRKRSSH